MSTNRPRSRWHFQKTIGTGVDPTDGVTKFMIMSGGGVDEQQPDGSWKSISTSTGAIIYSVSAAAEISGCAPVA